MVEKENISNWELWRNQTLVNRVKDNSTIAVEYYTLISFIVKEYKSRMESIQNPLLHLISHCLELSYKEVIEQACKVGYISVNTPQLVHSHNLLTLLQPILDIFQKFASESCCSDNDRRLFSHIFVEAHSRIIYILKTDVITYRYAYNRNRKNQIVSYSADLFESDNTSPNITEVYKLFNICFDSLSYTTYIIDYMFPEIEMTYR